MKIFLLTLEDITFNNLMPWLKHNNDTEKYDEIIRAIDLFKLTNHQVFFKQLIEKQNITGVEITPLTLNEWKRFTVIRRNKKFEELTKQLSAFSRRDAKVSFYTFLIKHSVSAIMTSILDQMAKYSSKKLREQFVNKYVIRLKRIINAAIPCIDHNENDLLIIKFVKLNAIAIYILLLREYKMFIDPYNEPAHNDIMTAITCISMADKELSRIVSILMEMYSAAVKVSSQPSPVNKLKELKEKDSQPYDEKMIGKQEQLMQQNADKSLADKPNDENAFYDSVKLMKILPIKKGTLKRCRDKYGLPFIRLGEKGKFLYPIKEFNIWVKENNILKKCDAH